MLNANLQALAVMYNENIAMFRDCLMIVMHTIRKYYRQYHNNIKPDKGIRHAN